MRELLLLICIPIRFDFEERLGVKVGEFTDICANKVGACAEISGADVLVRQGSRPENLKFTRALRPAKVWGEQDILDDARVGMCGNCKSTW